MLAHNLSIQRIFCLNEIMTLKLKINSHWMRLTTRKFQFIPVQLLKPYSVSLAKLKRERIERDGDV